MNPSSSVLGFDSSDLGLDSTDLGAEPQGSVCDLLSLDVAEGPRPCERILEADSSVIGASASVYAPLVMYA